MKTLLSFVIMATALNAVAVPRSPYIVSPSKIEVSGEKLLLTLDLKCKNESPNEWAGNLIALSDDSGDLVMGLAVVLAKSDCGPGPQKKFVLTYSLKDAGLSALDLKNGVTLEPLKR